MAVSRSKSSLERTFGAQTDNTPVVRPSVPSSARYGQMPENIYHEENKRECVFGI